MGLRVHHLDCATMCPIGGRWLNEDRHMVAHCLLVETEHDGLVLVDTGLGQADIAEPGRRLGRGFVAAVRPRRDPSRTAIQQIKALGLDPADVRHIVMTHLDLDHAGGLGDFPGATVHVHENERDAALSPKVTERGRYRKVHWAHGPKWATYGAGGEEWFGFPAVRELDGLPTGILTIPLWGHTRGHALVAVEGDDGWLLHCGDSYFHGHTVDPTRPQAGPALRAFEWLVAIDRERVRDNHRRLAELYAARGGPGGELRMFSAHDPAELRAFTG